MKQVFATYLFSSNEWEVPNTTAVWKGTVEDSTDEAIRSAIYKQRSSQKNIALLTVEVSEVPPSSSTNV